MKRPLIISLAFLLILNIVTWLPVVSAWELERSGGHITINERTENATTDYKASVGLGVHVQEYIENKLDWPSDGDDDVVNLMIVATGNSRKITEYGWGDGRNYVFHKIYMSR